MREDISRRVTQASDGISDGIVIISVDSVDVGIPVN